MTTVFFILFFSCSTQPDFYGWSQTVIKRLEGGVSNVQHFTISRTRRGNPERGMMCLTTLITMCSIMWMSYHSTSTSNIHHLLWTRLMLMALSWPDGSAGGVPHSYRRGHRVEILFIFEFSGLSSLRLNIGLETTAITSTLKIDSSTDNMNNNASPCTFGLGLNRLCHWYFEYFEELPFKKFH